MKGSFSVTKLFTIVVVSTYSISSQGITLPEYNKKLNTSSIAFIENKGQMHDQKYQPRPDVLYGTITGNMAVHIKKTGVSYQLFNGQKGEVKSQKAEELVGIFKETEPEEITIYRIDLNWLNANTNLTQSTDEALPGYNNYYLESCPNGALNVKSYTGITLHNLYNGINLHYYEKNGNLKHDYIIAPHANYKQIQIEVKGSDVSVNKDGSLLLTTPLGKVLEGAPIVYQHGRQIPAKWIVTKNILSFEVENYDPNSELIIDPVTRQWGTYVGGIGNDYGVSCNTDATGNVYLVGRSTSNTGTEMITTGAHQITYGGGSQDAFLTKFNTSGVRQWSTYYGGSGDDQGASCSTDGSSNVYLAGSTSSSIAAVIATAGAHQSIYGGGMRDGFLVKFNSSGVRQWGTYYGGSGMDYGTSSSMDATGNVYLVGYTNASTGTVIATSGAHQATSGSNNDAFVVKFNSSGVRQWGTFYGGSGNDSGISCFSDAAGNLFLSGQTTSSNGTSIATAGAHQTIFGGGISVNDAFLVKFNSNGVRQWGTYYGGNGNDFGYASNCDASGNIYLTGYTTDSNTGTVIATAGAHQTIYGGGIVDAFLVKFNSSGVRQWGTFYGGSGDDYGTFCMMDATGNVYLAGQTSTSTGTIIVTNGSHQPIHGGGANDGFLVEFNSSGTRQYGTYYGGNFSEAVSACHIDAFGNLYFSGSSNTVCSGTVICTPGSHQTAFGGGSNDAFMAKFAISNSVGMFENESHNNSIKIHPNPTKDLINIDVGTLNGNVELTVSNALGQIVRQEKLSDKNTVLNISDLEIGIYFIQLLSDNKTISTQKIIKQ